jgi:hypothetical protein
MIDSRVTERGTHVGGDLGLSVYECGTRLEVGHTCTLEDIQSVLVLLQEVIESRCSTETSKKW